MYCTVLLIRRVSCCFTNKVKNKGASKKNAGISVRGFCCNEQIAKIMPITK